MPPSTTSVNKISRRFAHQLVRSRTVEADLATIREILEPAAYLTSSQLLYRPKLEAQAFRSSTVMAVAIT